MVNDICYMCEAEATSVEHVPPKCLFPEAKDSGGQNYRVNLITVPSCDEHNGQKSLDDEFLMVSLAGILGNNSIGYQHYHGKIKRALKRSSSKLIDKVFLNKKIFRIEKDNKLIDILWGTPDYKRLINCFTHIAYGVYRHHYGTQFRGQVRSHLDFLHSIEKNQNSFKELIKHKVYDELVGKEKFGSNPSVFYYQFTDPDQFGIFLAKLCFYENIEVYSAYHPGDKEKPSLFEMELIKAGIKTTIHHGDKKYEFN